MGAVSRHGGAAVLALLRGARTQFGSTAVTVKLSGPMLAPQSGGPPRQVVVLLHGYGSDGQDLIALGQHWRALLPEGLFVAPNAPGACPDNPTGYPWCP